MIVMTTGSYTFKSISRINTSGSLYANNFNASNSLINQLVYGNNSGGNEQFQFTFFSQSGNYVLVVTTSSPNITGLFLILVNGPARVTFR